MESLHKWIVCVCVLLASDGGYCLKNGTSHNIVILGSDWSEVDRTSLDVTAITNTSLLMTTKDVYNANVYSFLRELPQLISLYEDVYIVTGKVCQKLYRDVLRWMYNISSTCHTAYSSPPEMAVLSPGGGLCPNISEEFSCTGFGDSSIRIVSLMLPSLAAKLRWKLIVIIHDLELGARIPYLSERLSYKGIRALTYLITDDMTENQIQTMLYLIYNTTKSEDRNIVILCTTSCAGKVIYQANSFDSWNQRQTALWMFSKWLIFEQNSDFCLAADLRLNNLAIISAPREIPFDGHNEAHQMQLINYLDGFYSEGVARNYSTVNMEITEGLEHSMDCWWGRVDTLLYKTEGRKFSSVGKFDHRGEITLEDAVYPNLKYGFNGNKLTVITNFWYPFITKSNTTESGFSGLCMDLLEELTESLNFTHDIILPSDGEWGILSSNDTWNGLVKEVYMKKADLAVAPLTVTSDRLKVMDFTTPFYYDYGIGIFKMPDPARMKWFRLIQPFKGMVLVCIGVSLIVCSVLLCTLETSISSLRTGKKCSLITVFQDNVWYLYGALLAHGGTHQPKSESGRVLVGFWWLFSIVIAASYSGTLIAFLTVNKETLPFQTLEEVSNHPEYKWGTTGETAWQSFFEASSRSDVQALWAGIERYAKHDPNVLTRHYEIQKEKVLNGSYVFFGEKDSVSMWVQEECDLATLKETFYPFSLALGLVKDSPFTALLSKRVMAIDQSGLLQSWKRKWWPLHNKCLEAGTPYAQSILLEDLQSAFYLIAIGVVVAGIALGFELMYEKIRLQDSLKPKSLNNGMRRF